MGISLESFIYPDLNKQTQEVIFLKKIRKLSHQQIGFDNALVFTCYCITFQKYLRILLDEKLNHHVKQKMCKAMKGINVIKRVSEMLP